MGMMNGFINSIESMFEKEFSPEGKEMLEKRLYKFSDDVFNMAIKDIENANLNWRPKWLEVLRYCEAAEKKLVPKPEEEKIINASSLQKRMGMKLVDLILSGKATRGEILGMYRKAENAQKNSGWAKAAMELEAHYEFHNLSLDEKPVGAISAELI